MNPENHQPNDPHLGERVEETLSDSSKDVLQTNIPRPAKKRRGGLLLALLGVLALGYIGVKPRMEQSHKLSSEVAELKNEMPSVSVVSLKKSSGATEVALPSNLQAIEETTIDARTSGYVKARYVDIGSQVQAGQILADIESPEMDQQVLQARSQVSRSRAGVGQANADVSRLQSNIAAAQAQVALFVANLGQAQADLKHLQAKAVEANSAVDVARAKLTQAQKRLDGMKAELQRANVGEDIARKTLVRWKELFKADAVSGQDVDEKQSDYDASRARVDAARADVNSAQADVIATEGIVNSQLAEYDATRADVASGEQKIQAAQAGLRSAHANYGAAVAARNASLSNVDAANANVGSDQANVRRYEALQGFEHVLAPFSGVITARNVDVGDLVNATSSGSGASNPMNTVTTRGLFGLAKTDVLLAQANVPEDSVSSIREGQDAEVTVREYPDKRFLGKVFLVSGALDAQSRTLLVEVKVPNPIGSLKPGMYAQIQFLGAKSGSTLRIPATALIFDAKGTRVAIVTKEGKLHYIPVKLGRDFGGEIEVLGGLTGDETVVTNPDDSLSEGQSVRAVPVAK
jgi:RND family efflux transporter MFP subunit